jgi:hypothetical protein
VNKMILFQQYPDEKITRLLLARSTIFSFFKIRFDSG